MQLAICLSLLHWGRLSVGASLDYGNGPQADPGHGPGGHLSVGPPWSAGAGRGARAGILRPGREGTGAAVQREDLADRRGAAAAAPGARPVRRRVRLRVPAG